MLKEVAGMAIRRACDAHRSPKDKELLDLFKLKFSHKLGSLLSSHNPCKQVFWVERVCRHPNLWLHNINCHIYSNIHAWHESKDFWHQNTFFKDHCRTPWGCGTANATRRCQCRAALPLPMPRGAAPATRHCQCHAALPVRHCPWAAALPLSRDFLSLISEKFCL